MLLPAVSWFPAVYPIVVEGDMFSWGKACPVLSAPHTHTTDPHPTTTLSWSAPAPWAPSVINYTNCIDLKVKEDNTSPCFVLRLWISLHSLCVCECGFSRKRKMRIIHCQQPWGKSPVLALLLERLCITAKFYVHHSRDRSLMQDRTIEECSEFVEFEHVDGSKYCEFKKKKSNMSTRCSNTWRAFIHAGSLLPPSVQRGVVQRVAFCV